MRKSDCKGTALYSQCQACYRGLINIENNTRKRAETLFFDHSKTLMVLKQEKKDVVQFCERSEILLLVEAADFKKMVFAFLGLRICAKMVLAF